MLNLLTKALVFAAQEMFLTRGSFRFALDKRTSAQKQASAQKQDKPAHGHERVFPERLVGCPNAIAR